MSPLSAADRTALLALAREAALAPDRPPVAAAAGALAQPRGAVVTVTVGGEVRGAYGTLAALAPLAIAVAEAARRAATADPRFPPPSPADAARLRVEVAVLGPPRPLPLEARGAPPAGHGIQVTRGWHRATVLPAGGARAGWEGPGLLKHACLQASLHARAWEEPETQVQVFEAEEFGEEPVP